MEKPNFMVNLYDDEGDVLQEGIFIYFGDTSIRFNDLTDLKEWRDDLNQCIDELEEYYE